MKPDHPKDAVSTAKPKKIRFGENGKAVELVKDAVSTAKPKKIRFGENGKAVELVKDAVSTAKPKKIRFGEDGKAVELVKDAVSTAKPKKIRSGEDGIAVEFVKDAVSTAKPKKIRFGEDGKAVELVKDTVSTAKPKKIRFGEDGNAVECVNAEDNKNGSVAEEDYFTKRERLEQDRQLENAEEDQQKWYELFPSISVKSVDEVLDMKETEQMELFNLCKSSYDSEKSTFNKRNPSDARWLQTALHKGTARDRANAGALLVTSNPLGNLDALLTLISYSKLSNKASTEVINVLTDLWQEVLLPPQRKLLPIKLRGAEWKLIRNDTKIPKEKQRRRYAYWYFENELKEAYFEFLKNLQQNMQSGQETNKNTGIVAASKLLAYAPEKEQMLLTMVVNKLGDPLPKVASKALHHLTEVAHRHPNMCGVVVVEAEKLLFRNNVSDRAQHFALCFLASIATFGTAQVCTKLVNICFALFKVLVQKGAINNRTMQAILRCLQKAIVEAEPAKGETEILSKDMQDTVYRLVHLADVRISVQTLGLLLQMIAAKSEKPDRFYNALYKKMLDLELCNIGTNTAAQLLHIIHRAIHLDGNIARAKAFIKRLLQMTLYMPTQIAAGCLIVLSKLLRSRKELANHTSDALMTSELLELLDGKGKIGTKKEEAAEETKPSNCNGHGDEQKFNSSAEKDSEIKNESSDHKGRSKKYDAFHRVPAFSRAEFASRDELILLCEHIHPTVKLFAENILLRKRISYYGDPLRDFGLTHFLERFAFKNPKKIDNEKAETPGSSSRQYVATGSRGQSVNSLTKATCTEDELFIFNFLEQKRQKAALNLKEKKSSEEDDDESSAKPTDIDDDEFDQYLDGFFGKKAKSSEEVGEDDEEMDFLKEIGGALVDDPKSKKSKKKLAKTDDDAVDDIDADWGEDDGDGNEEDDDDDEDEDDQENSEGELDFDKDESISEDERGSIDLEDGDESDDNEDDNGGSMLFEENDSDDDDDDDESGADDSDDESTGSIEVKKKSRKQNSMLDSKTFAKQLNKNKDMSSLFAAADEFAELLEETAKVKGQGTTNAVFNRDKSSTKQLKWEEKRRSNAKSYGSNRKRKFAMDSNKSGGKKFPKKSKK